VVVGAGVEVLEEVGAEVVVAKIEVEELVTNVDLDVGLAIKVLVVVSAVEISVGLGFLEASGAEDCASEGEKVFSTIIKVVSDSNDEDSSVASDKSVISAALFGASFFEEAVVFSRGSLFVCSNSVFYYSLLWFSF